MPIFTKAIGRRSRHGVQLRQRRRARRDHDARARDGRAGVDRGRRRLRPARSERRAGRAHRRRLDDHRDRSDPGAARGGAEGGRDARARSQRRGRQARRSACARCRRGRPIVCGPAAAIPAGRRPAPAPTSWSKPPAPTRCRRSSKPARTRPASCRCSRPIRCARSAATSSRPALSAGNITLPGTLFTIGGVTHHGGQAGGASPMRDIPRFVELLEQGQYDAQGAGDDHRPARADARGVRGGRLSHDRHGDHGDLRQSPISRASRVGFSRPEAQGA